MSPIRGVAYLSRNVANVHEAALYVALIQKKAEAITPLMGAFPDIEFNETTGLSNVLAAGVMIEVEKRGITVTRRHPILFVVTPSRLNTKLQSSLEKTFSSKDANAQEHLEVGKLHLYGSLTIAPTVLFSRGGNGEINHMVVVDKIKCTGKELAKLQAAARLSAPEYESVKREILPQDDKTTLSDLPARKFMQIEEIRAGAALFYDSERGSLYYGYTVFGQNMHLLSEQFYTRSEGYHKSDQPLERMSWPYIRVFPNASEPSGQFSHDRKRIARQIRAITRLIDVLES